MDQEFFIERISEPGKHQLICKFDDAEYGVIATCKTLDDSTMKAMELVVSKSVEQGKGIKVNF